MNREPGSSSGDFPVWVAGEWAERCFKRSCEAVMSRQFTGVTSSFLSKLCGRQLVSTHSVLFLHRVALLAAGISWITVCKARDEPVEILCVIFRCSSILIVAKTLGRHFLTSPACVREGILYPSISQTLDQGLLYLSSPKAGSAEGQTAAITAPYTSKGSPKGDPDTMPSSFLRSKTQTGKMWSQMPVITPRFTSVTQTVILISPTGTEIRTSLDRLHSSLPTQRTQTAAPAPYCVMVSMLIQLT